MKKTLSTVALAAVLTLAGCAGVKPPSYEEAAKADYGTLTDEQATKIIRTHLETTLIDPTSYLLRGPTKIEQWWQPEGSGYRYGLLVRYSVNAKNRYGGYTGWTPKALFVMNGYPLASYTVYTDGLHDDNP